MKIAIIGEPTYARAELAGRAVAAGLNMMTSVSRHTSVLVTNEPTSGSTKPRRAAAEGVPVIDEPTFLRLLTDVRGGTAHEATTASASTAPPTTGVQATEPEPSTPAPVPSPPSPDTTTAPAPRQLGAPARDLAKPLTGRRVLIPGGDHTDAAAPRTRVVELGGSAAVNLSAGVTDVVVLADGEQNRRRSRVVALELPLHEASWPTSPTATAADAADTTAVPAEGTTCDAEGRRHRPPMPSGTPAPRPAPEWHLTVSWAPRSACEIDIVAFILDEDEQVTFDEHFIFYGAPESPARRGAAPHRRARRTDHRPRPRGPAARDPRPATRDPQGRSRRGRRQPGHLRNGRPTARARSTRLPAPAVRPSPGPPRTPRRHTGRKTERAKKSSPVTCLPEQ